MLKTDDGERATLISLGFGPADAEENAKYEEMDRGTYLHDDKGWTFVRDSKDNVWVLRGKLPMEPHNYQVFITSQH